MMKKTTQTLLLVFSTLLLLVSVTVSAQGHPAQTKRTDLSDFTGVWNTVTDKSEKLVITLRHERADPGDDYDRVAVFDLGAQAGLRQAAL